MQLCDKDIYRELAKGELMFAGSNPGLPFDMRVQVQPASVDLRLGSRFMKFKADVRRFDIVDIRLIGEAMETVYYGEGDAIEVGPNEALFGQVYEQVAIPDYLSARIEGRSRVARLGVSVHCTGDYINPGFAGAMPLQIVNHNAFPIVLYPYIEICQMILYRLSDAPLVSYLQRSVLPNNVYFNETNPSPSVLSCDVEGEVASDGEGSIVEARIRGLIENYYETVRNDAVSGTSLDRGAIAAATRSNYQLFISTSEGGVNMGDQYIARQVGVQGREAGENAEVTQAYLESGVAEADVGQLLDELNAVKERLRLRGDDESDVLVGDVSRASLELKAGDSGKAMEHLRRGGQVLYDVACATGCGMLAGYLGKMLGM